MAAHKHADIIIAKAKDMDLVAFIKMNDDGGWHELTHGYLPSFRKENEYFLCLPQHRDVCWHWLNGGEVQQSPIDIDQWVLSGSNKNWFCKHSFMHDTLMFRTKPRKEKRWIAIRNLDTVAMNNVFESMELAKEYCGNGKFSIHEIELEV